jgi:hypothetical protein
VPLIRTIIYERKKNMYNSKNVLYSIAGSILIMFLLATAVSPQEMKKKENSEKAPEKGIFIELSVYSGRPNPQWWITPGDPEYKELVILISSLKSTKKAMFDRDEWNKLGYASFWIKPKNVKGLPKSVQVWRDMGYIIQNEAGQVLYTRGATKIYDTLVAYAEKRGQEHFFINYHKYRAEMKTKTGH